MLDQGDRLQTFAAFRRKRFDDLRLKRPDLSLHPMTPRLQPWESAWFMQGLRSRLFDVEPRECRDGWAAAYTGALFDQRPGGALDAHFFHTIPETAKLGRGVTREQVTTMAAVTRLVLEFGHRPESIRLETVDWALDAEVLPDSAGARPPLAVEAKVDPFEHEAMVLGLLACRGIGSIETHQLVVLGATGRRLGPRTAENHHRKCKWVAGYKPEAIWVVSPKRSSVFEVIVGGADFVLAPAEESRLIDDQVGARQAPTQDLVEHTSSSRSKE